ncbi:MAG: DUF2828 family protein [Firmicutes bacterium]|nr:DUF2828 family protein [Bacillota bacterium]
MENKFSNEVRNVLNGTGEYTRTENDGLQYRTTGTALLDLFATIGALREKSEEDIVVAFKKAKDEDALLAMKMLFYARNIRGGLGERRTFRIILNCIADNEDIIKKNIALIPEFGRWDDLFVLFGTASEKIMLEFVKKQFESDLANYESGNKAEISLLGKWLKSENSSSKEGNKMGTKLRKAFGLTSKEYRKALSILRAHLRIVEKDMSANDWGEIKYESVPSYAMKNYNLAFHRHDHERFTEYIEDVNSGNKKINSSTLFPYDLVKKYIGAWRYILPGIDPVAEAQWKALPNYVEGNKNIMVIADTSGSMNNGVSIYASIGLAIYFAERNHGAFHNLLMIFAGYPILIELIDNTSLYSKINRIPEIYQGNTDIGKAFRKILEIGITAKVAPEDMPEALLIITDMEFDPSSMLGKTAYETAKSEFKSRGYNLPKVIFWNVSQSSEGYQSTGNDEGVIMVSGTSASTFKSVLAHIDKTPYEFMLEVLSDPVYDRVCI